MLHVAVSDLCRNIVERFVINSSMCQSADTKSHHTNEYNSHILTSDANFCEFLHCVCQTHAVDIVRKRSQVVVSRSDGNNCVTRLIGEMISHLASWRICELTCYPWR